MTLDVLYEFNGASLETSLSDLSVRGAYVDTSTPLPPGSEINLIFILPDGMVVETEAKVAHSQPGSGMGVTFTNLSLEQANYIRQFITA